MAEMSVGVELGELSYRALKRAVKAEEQQRTFFETAFELR
jgi:hypothetical protein